MTGGDNGRRVLVVASMVLMAASVGRATAASRWIGAWAASPSGIISADTLKYHTIRQTVHLGASGKQFRLRLSNEESDQPIVIDSVSVAQAGATAGMIDPSSIIPVTFAGRSHITIPPRAAVLGDAIASPVAAMTDLTVSLFVAGSTGSPTGHLFAQSIVWIAPGDQTTAPTLGQARKSTSRYIVSGVDTLPAVTGGTIVAIGDSLTDGVHSKVDGNRRWPDVLSQRLQTAGTVFAGFGVVDAGIGGDLLLDDAASLGVLARLPRDVLTEPNLRYVCVLIGVNDIIAATSPGGSGRLDAATLEQGYRQIIARVREAGGKVLIGTIPPYAGYPGHTERGEDLRKSVNAWIRRRDGFDGVMDFDAVLADPGRPDRLLPSYDSGDHIHPNDAGYAAMAGAIDLGLFQP